MSNALAIAHVTQALALLIEANLGPETDMAVKVEPRKPPADPPAEPTISVFLYQVTPDTSQRNTDLPTRAPDGQLVRRPAAALDLHYLISAYGEDNELVGQRLIGSVVRTLHEIPVLPKDIIELAAERPYLAGSNLAEAAQRVRFTPTVMDIDETSKLWGMLYQTPYSLSVVYQAALILIDGRETPAPAKPVQRPEVRVLPFGAPGAPVPPAARPQAPGSGAGAPAPAPAETTAKPPDRAPGRAAARARTPSKTAKTTKAAQTAKTAKATQTAKAAQTTKAAKSSKRAPTSRSAPSHDTTDGKQDKGTGPGTSGSANAES